MAENSNIEWTGATWNPTVGCSVTSPGCTNCYAMKLAGRLEAMGSPIYRGHTVKTKAGFVWNGTVAASNHGQMIKPLFWKKPHLIFVNSMSDLFHEDMPLAVIDEVFAVMASCPQHTFQVLTKRDDRMRQYCQQPSDGIFRAMNRLHPAYDGDGALITLPAWPLPNVWLGVSIEDCERKARIDELRATPASVRFLSLEPLLEDLGDIDLAGIHWVIIGGESGPGARGYCYEWARSIIQQCQAAGVPVFHKQVGAHPIGFDDRRVHLRDKKGGDPALWPEELRVRQMPGVVAGGVE